MTNNCGWFEEDHPAWPHFFAATEEEDSMRLPKRWQDFRNGWDMCKCFGDPDDPTRTMLKKVEPGDRIICPVCECDVLKKKGEEEKEMDGEPYIVHKFTCFNGHDFEMAVPAALNFKAVSPDRLTPKGDSPCGPCA